MASSQLSKVLGVSFTFRGFVRIYRPRTWLRCFSTSWHGSADLVCDRRQATLIGRLFPSAKHRGILAPHQLLPWSNRPWIL